MYYDDVLQTELNVSTNAATLALEFTATGTYNLTISAVDHFDNTLNYTSIVTVFNRHLTSLTMRSDDTTYLPGDIIPIGYTSTPTLVDGDNFRGTFEFDDHHQT